MPLICGAPPWDLVSCAGSGDKTTWINGFNPRTRIDKATQIRPEDGPSCERWQSELIDHGPCLSVSVYFSRSRYVLFINRISTPNNSRFYLGALFPPVRLPWSCHSCYFLSCVHPGEKILSTTWSSLLHAKPRGRACCIYPPFPVPPSHQPPALPFDCSKDLLSMSIIVFCCFFSFLALFQKRVFCYW